QEHPRPELQEPLTGVGPEPDVAVASGVEGRVSPRVPELPRSGREPDGPRRPGFQFLWSPHDEVNRHRRRYTKRRLAALPAATNWRVDRLSYFNTLLFPPIAGVRLLGKLHAQRSGPARSDLSWGVPSPVNAVEPPLRRLASLAGNAGGLAYLACAA
ncbi:MAG TPA: hypothetical protein VKI65_08700, partial [Gemmataceae bacterium]|nr:hypothetical protein [Gemmataceae bacterium]